jgi:thioredoxin-like negative regulator of GroEL
MLEPRVRLLKLNADEVPQVSAQLGVRGIPAMFLFRGGQKLAQTAGARDSNAIVGWVQQHLVAAGHEWRVS